MPSQLQDPMLLKPAAANEEARARPPGIDATNRGEPPAPRNTKENTPSHFSNYVAPQRFFRIFPLYPFYPLHGLQRNSPSAETQLGKACDTRLKKARRMDGAVLILQSHKGLRNKLTGVDAGKKKRRQRPTCSKKR